MDLLLSISEANGNLKKTSKALLLRKLEGDVLPSTSINADFTFIADGMGFVRKMKLDDLSYSQFQFSFLKGF